MYQKRMDDLREKDSEIYERARRNSVAKENKKRKKKKNLQKKIISTTLIAISSFSLGIAAANAAQLHIGANNIAKEFYPYTEGYKVEQEGRGGYILNPKGISIVTFQEGEGLSIEPAYKFMIEEYENDEGKVKAWIAASEAWGKKFANEYVGELSREEINAAKKNAYYEEKVKEYNNGGFSK